MAIGLTLNDEHVLDSKASRSMPVAFDERRMRLLNLITLVSIFLFYINAPAVGAKFHGIPLAVAGIMTLLPIVPVSLFAFFHRRPLIVHRAVWPALAFLVIQMISAFRSDRPEVAFSEVTSTLMEGILVVVVFANAIQTPRLLRSCVSAMVLAGSILGGLSAWQQMTGHYDSNFGGFAQMSDAAFQVDEQADSVDEESLDGYQRRLAGPIGEQNRYAQIMLVLIPLGLMLATSATTRRQRTLYTLQVMLICTGTILTFSRGAAVGAAAIFLAMFLFRWISWSQGFAVLTGGIILMLLIPSYRQRLEPIAAYALPGLVSPASTGQSMDGSMKSRLTEMMAAWRAYQDHPLLGVGPGLYRYRYRDYAGQLGLRVLTTMRRAHCLYLELAAETGTLGLVAFSSVIGVTLSGLLRMRHRLLTHLPDLSALLTGLILAWLAYLTTSVFLHMSFVRYFWLLVAISSAAIWVSQVEWHRLQAQPLSPRSAP